MKNIINTTILCVDTKNKIDALLALDKSVKDMNFDKCIFLTDNIEGIKINKFKNLSSINFEIINIPTINSKSEYSKFCVHDLKKYIDTDFCLTIQHDGFIINSETWTDEFLDYDYIGAPWPTSWGYSNRIGNGGFCLKSKKYLQVVSNVLKDWNFAKNRESHDITDNEDYLANVTFYNELIKYGIKFPTTEIAAKFSIEHPILESVELPFGFHDMHSQIGKIAMRKKYENII